MRFVCLSLALILMSACGAGYGQSKDTKMCLSLADTKDVLPKRSYRSVAEFEIDIMKALAAEKSPDNAAKIESSLRARYSKLTERELKQDAMNLYEELGDCYNKHLVDSHRSNAFSTSRSNIAALMKQLAAFYIPQEKAQFLKATNNRKVCSSIAERLYPNSSAPNNNCVYSSSSFPSSLAVVQSTGHGILVKPQMAQFEPFNFKTAFIANDNPLESNLVDGAHVESGIFEYTGVVTYQSFLGPRSVYSFRRIKVWKDNEVRFFSAY